MSWFLRKQTANIFISYRREDTSGYAGRLFDSLAKHFGKQVFMDIDTIEPGVDFVQVIEQAVSSCDVLIALVGRQWLTVADTTGHRRLDNPEDFVHIEITTALNRNIRVIPVLVQGASMPSQQNLPEALATLARKNAIEISDSRWAYDVKRLVKVVKEELARRKRSTTLSTTNQGQNKSPNSTLTKIFEGRYMWLRLHSPSFWLVITVIGLTCLALTIAGYKLISKPQLNVTPITMSTPKSFEPNPNGKAFGLDISQHNGNIDWNKINKNFISFVMVKATQGKGFKDKNFDTNWQQLKEAGIIRGAYHFFTHSTDASAQATHFAQIVRFEPSDLPPILDIEDDVVGQTQADDATLVKQVRVWLQLVEQLTGRKPIIYTTAHFWNAHMTEEFGDYPLWVAKFSDVPKSMPKGWSKWTFWQYSDQASVDGVGTVDTNIFNGSYDDLKGFVNH